MASSERTETAHPDAHSSADAHSDAPSAGSPLAERAGAGDQAGAIAPGHVPGPVATVTPLEARTLTCIANAQYHSSREAFLDTVHRWFMFLVIAMGAAALTDVLPRLLHSEVATVKEMFAASAAILAALDLTFDLSNRARAHAMMKRRYFELLADLREGQKSPDQVEVCLERFSADEEPLYRVLYLACWNSAQMTVFGKKAKRFQISFFGNLFKNWARRPAANYPVIDLRTA
jgi:hypothetical protein